MPIPKLYSNFLIIQDKKIADFSARIHLDKNWLLQDIIKSIKKSQDTAAKSFVKKLKNQKIPRIEKNAEFIKFWFSYYDPASRNFKISIIKSIQRDYKKFLNKKK